MVMAVSIGSNTSSNSKVTSFIKRSCNTIMNNGISNTAINIVPVINTLTAACTFVL